MSTPITREDHVARIAALEAERDRYLKAVNASYGFQRDLKDRVVSLEAELSALRTAAESYANLYGPKRGVLRDALDDALSSVRGSERQGEGPVQIDPNGSKDLDEGRSASGVADRDNLDKHLKELGKILRGAVRVKFTDPAGAKFTWEGKPDPYQVIALLVGIETAALPVPSGTNLEGEDQIEAMARRICSEDGWAESAWDNPSQYPDKDRYRELARIAPGTGLSGKETE